MNATKKVITFPCQEVGCNGTVSSQKQAYIQTSCTNGEIGFACPVCGRLHFTDGKPVVSAQHEKAFLGADNAVEHKPYNRFDLAGLVSDFQKMYREDESRLSDIVLDMIYLHGLGHTADCNKQWGGTCNCGLEEIETFLAEHP